MSYLTSTKMLGFLFFFIGSIRILIEPTNYLLSSSSAIIIALSGWFIFSSDFEEENGKI